MRYIPTTDVLIEKFKQAAHNMKRSTAIKQSDALDRVATFHGYDHWGHVTWCLKETARLRSKGLDMKADLINPDNLSFGDEVDYIIKCGKDGDSTMVSLKTCLLFSTSDGDAWLLDVVSGNALCLLWRRERQAFRIAEDEKRFFVEHDARFDVKGDSFIVSSANPNIGDRTIALRYPAREIAGFAEFVQQREGRKPGERSL